MRAWHHVFAETVQDRPTAFALFAVDGAHRGRRQAEVAAQVVELRQEDPLPHARDGGDEAVAPAARGPHAEHGRRKVTGRGRGQQEQTGREVSRMSAPWAATAIAGPTGRMPSTRSGMIALRVRRE